MSWTRNLPQNAIQDVGQLNIDIKSMNEPRQSINLESLIEGLYEEITDKIHSSASILEFISINDSNVHLLAINEYVMSAICRVFREDGRQSMILITNLLSILLRISKYEEYNKTLTENKVGDTSFKIIEYVLSKVESSQEQQIVLECTTF